MFAFAKNLVSTIEQSASTIISQPHSQDDYFPGDISQGLRILSVKPDSKAFSLGLESWFDFIIQMNGHELPILPAEQLLNYDLLTREIENNLNREITFTIWNAKGGKIRTIAVPINSFDNQLDEIDLNNSVDKLYINKFSKIGIAVQLAPLETATYVWHILKTQPGSPAYKAGLVPYGDYIIGMKDGLLATGGEALLSRVISSILKRNGSLETNIVLYVYNHDYDTVRPVNVVLGTNNAMLGCDVGYGYLHRVPEVIGKFEQEEEDDKDMIFENNNFITPFNEPSGVSLAIPSAPNNLEGGIPATHKKKKRVYNTTVGGLNDYLNEELEKSREADHLDSARTASSVPPPPKKL